MTKCTRCLLHACLCSEVPTIATRTRIVIVRHHHEQWRSSNSGRLANLALANSVIVESGGGGGTQLPSLEGAWLVFPEGPPTTSTPDPPPGQLVVLDATWSQARRMYRKLAELRGLPILRLPEPARPVARLRAQPSPDRVSTIEAIAGALRLVAEPAAAEALERLFAVAVERSRSMGRIHDS